MQLSTCREVKRTNSVTGAGSDLKTIGESLAGAEVDEVALVSQGFGLNSRVGAQSSLAVEEGTGLDGVWSQDGGIAATLVLAVVPVVAIVTIVAVVSIIAIVVVIPLIVVIVIVVIVVVLCSS
jgi:hypothetical protein